MSRTDLTVARVAAIAGCHRNTVLNYERRGFIRSQRDINGFRRYSLDEALRLKEILSGRTDEPVCGSMPANSKVSQALV